MKKLISKILSLRKKKITFKDLSLALCCLFMMHVLSMISFEGLSFFDSIWLTATSMTTIGYGDLSPKTLFGRITTVLLVYLGGLSILAQIFEKYFEYRMEIKKKITFGLHEYSVENHIALIIVSQNISTSYIYKVVSHIKNSNVKKILCKEIVILGRCFPKGIPDILQELNIKYVYFCPSKNDLMSQCYIKNASIVVVIACPEISSLSDSITFDICYRIRIANKNVHIIAELYNDDNRKRLHKEAYVNQCIRPIRAYPELLSKAILTPGVTPMLENLLNSNQEECIRINICKKIQWGIISSHVTNVIGGIALGYIDANTQKTISNPPPQQEVHMSAIFVIISREQVKQEKDIEEKLKCLR